MHLFSNLLTQIFQTLLLTFFHKQSTRRFNYSWRNKASLLFFINPSWVGFFDDFSWSSMFLELSERSLWFSSCVKAELFLQINHMNYLVFVKLLHSCNIVLPCIQRCQICSHHVRLCLISGLCMSSLGINVAIRS